MDEILEFGIASQPVSSIVTSPDGFPPLFNIVLHFCIELVGQNEATRWFSVGVSLCAMLFFWQVVKLIAGPKAGAWALLFMAFSPFDVYFAQQARAYALYYFFVIFFLWAFLAFLQQPDKRRALLLIFATCGGMYTHYYFVFVLITFATTTTLFWYFTKNAKLIPIRQLLAVSIAIVVFCLPIAWLLWSDIKLQQGYFGKTSFTLATFGYSYVAMLTGFTLGPSVRELHSLSFRDALLQFAPWLSILVPTVIYLLVRVFRKLQTYLQAILRCEPSSHSTKTKSTNAMILAVGILATTTILPVLLVGFTSNLVNVGYIVRYIGWVEYPIIALLAIGVDSEKKYPRAYLAAAIILLSFLIALVNRQSSQNHQTENAKAAAAYIFEQPENSIMVQSGYMSGVLNHYLNRLDDKSSKRVFAIPPVRNAQELAKVRDIFHAQINPGEQFWLLYSRPFHGDPQGAMLRNLKSEYSLTLKKKWAGIRLYLGKCRE